jgi:putative inorganic carbon (HCO3(-)) transporter
VIAAGATAQLTMISIQLGCAFAVVVLTLGLYFVNRSVGLVAVWLTWLLAPFLRRLFFLAEPIEKTEPLALVPFLVTAVVVVIELRQVTFSPRTRRLLQLVVAGYALGFPVGLLFFPLAAMFALFTYVTAVGCFVIGYRDADKGWRPVLPTLLMIVTPFLSLYAFVQYFAPLPEWDYVWRNTADIITVGSDDQDRIRVWSTLNAPGTFALVLAVAALAFVAMSRVTPLRLAAAAAVFGALALTYVRSAWFGVVVALLAILIVTRGAAIKRVAPVVAVLAVLAPLTLGGSTGTALTERAESFGSLEHDESTQERIETPQEVLPFALSAPLGSGMGSAGEATKLSDTGFRHTDNAYLSILYQVGPVGFLLVMSGVVAGIVSAWRNAWRRTAAIDVLACGVLTMFFVTMFSGDHLYGVGGMMIWYMTGLAIRRREMNERRPT